MAAQMVEPALADRHMADLVVEDHLQDIGRGIVANAAQPRDHRRSEEHTSELQSLMRISYAVFCLKKKKNSHRHVRQGNNTEKSTTKITLSLKQKSVNNIT